MTDESVQELRRRARRALERSLQSDPLRANELPDAELLARLEAAVRLLPRRRQEIFLAVRLDGTSYTELAEQTELSVRQIEREVARALVQIDRALHDRRPERSWRRWFG